MFLERNILEPYFLVCTVIIFSPMIAIHVISSYKMADIQEICVQQGLYPFFHDFFLGIRLNSLLEITAFAFNPSKFYSMMATELCTSLYDIKTFCCCQTQILFTLLIAELNIVTLCGMVSRSFDLVIPFIYRFFPPSRKIKSSIM